jgi:predicted DCC family thiol-disulfide oxidoreductase YuxK
VIWKGLKMNTMGKLTVFHDPRCGLCCGFRHWLEAQPRWVAVDFVDWASDEAERRLPGIRGMDAGKDVVVLADDGRWWQGTAAWLTCLWATRDYREWSHRLAAPVFQPLVRKVVGLLSENRLTFSRLLRLPKDAELAEAIQALPEVVCEDGVCRRRAG